MDTNSKDFKYRDFLCFVWQGEDGKWRSNVDGNVGGANTADTEADATAMVKEDVDWIITNM